MYYKECKHSMRIELQFAIIKHIHRWHIHTHTSGYCFTISYINYSSLTFRNCTQTFYRDRRAQCTHTVCVCWTNGHIHKNKKKEEKSESKCILCVWRLGFFYWTGQICWFFSPEDIVVVAKETKQQNTFTHFKKLNVQTCKNKRNVAYKQARSGSCSSWF